MSHQSSKIESSVPSVFTLDVSSASLTDQQFEQLCRDNRELRIELTSKGELILMPPCGSITGWRSGRILQRLANWTEQDGTGLAFDASTGFTLPDGSKRSPDASWIRRERWEALTRDEQDRFAPLAPDFVIELWSHSDSWPLLEEKMLDYLQNGVRFGWLIDPERKRVHIYRPGQAIEVLDHPVTVSAEPLLRGFVFTVEEIW